MDHDFLGPGHDEKGRRTRAVVLLTLVMMAGEIVVGQLSGSMALLADGFHMGTHAIALGVAALAYRYARTHVANPRFSFGTGKIGDLSGFASALVLGVFAIGIAWESADRLLHPVPVAFAGATLVAVLGLVVNLASAALLAGGHSGHGHGHAHGHGHDHAHDHGEDHNFRAAYVHVLADALTSVLAIAALLGGRWLGWVWLDPAVGLLGAVVIARWSWTLMRDTALVLLDAADPALVAEVRDRVESPGDARIVDLHVWRIGPAACAAIVAVEGTADRAAICARLRPVSRIAHLNVDLVRAAAQQENVTQG